MSENAAKNIRKPISAIIMKVSDNYHEGKCYAMNGAEFGKKTSHGVKSIKHNFLKNKIIFKQNQKTTSLIAQEILFSTIWPSLVISGSVVMKIFSAAYRVTPWKNMKYEKYKKIMRVYF